MQLFVYKCVCVPGTGNFTNIRLELRFKFLKNDDLGISSDYGFQKFLMDSRTTIEGPLKISVDIDVYQLLKKNYSSLIIN